MSYNSKYTGQEIEEMLDQIANGEIGGGDSSSKVYIFPFTTQDIIDATERDEPYRLSEGQIAEILDAINTKKRILIRQYPDVEGYNVIDSIYRDDMIYVHFIDLFSSYPATSCDFAIDMSAMNVTDFRMGTIATESNLKTINGESIVGEGNIVISGGSAGSAAYPEINHGTNDTILTLAPNTFHIWDEVESLQLVCARPTAGIANEYLFQFTSGATATTLYLPDSIKWVGGSAPTIKPNMIYQISILNDLGSVLEFDNAPALIDFIIQNTGYQADVGMTWEEWCNSSYNTDGFYIASGIVRKNENIIVVNSSSYASILANDIIDAITYTIIPG